jgi:hypothetical protein
VCRIDKECHAMRALDAQPSAHAVRGAFELRFRSLFREGRALAFACDAQGRIDLDRLSERARERYLYARALVGREFAAPEVLPT